MKNALRYLVIFVLGALAAMVLAAAFMVYQTANTMRGFFSGMDTYTCRQFEYDLTQSDTDKMYPVTVATIAYGGIYKDEKGHLDTDRLSEDLGSNGVKPAVQKVLQLCKGNPGSRVMTLFAHDIVSSTAPAAVSATITTEPSPTAVKE